MSDDLAALFRRHLCQTSAAPLGIEVARAAGSTVWDASGRAYLDLLAGMGVANVGHTHPEVVAAVRAQAERHLHVMVYGEFVEEAQVRLAARRPFAVAHARLLDAHHLHAGFAHHHPQHRRPSILHVAGVFDGVAR